MITGWKFLQLDVDKDRLIRDDELFSSQMKKMFGHIRRGRKCSKKLAVLCDFDRNGGLSLDEWRKCLGRTTLKGIVKICWILSERDLVMALPGSLETV